MTHIVTLPWPPKELNPNKRLHWSKKAPITKAYKEACWALCKEAGLTLPMAGAAPLYIALRTSAKELPRYHLWIDFFAPDRRHRDDDNCIQSFKAGRDGVALALGINDSQFICHPFLTDEIGGMVKIRITSGLEP